MTSNETLKDPSANGLRNIAGAVSTILGVGGGVALAAWAFSVPSSKIEWAMSVAIAVSLGLYADAYHKSIENSIAIWRLCVAAFIVTLPASFILASLSKFMPQ